MVFAEFYYAGVLTGEPVPACGDRAVIILDGRNSWDAWHRIASTECVQRRYMGYRIMQGDTFARSQPLSHIVHPKISNGCVIINTPILFHSVNS